MTTTEHEEKIVWVSTEDVSRMTGIPLATVANWRKKTPTPGPPWYQFGGSKGLVRYKLVDVIDWRERHRHG